MKGTSGAQMAVPANGEEGKTKTKIERANDQKWTIVSWTMKR
jgi:hypothetical protein